MSNLLIYEPPLQVLPTLAKEIGLNEAIVLQQIHYWLSNKKVGKWHNGRKWVRNSVDQWQEDNFPFWSTATIRRIISKLESEGYILSDNLNKMAYDRTLWYAIDYDAISAICVNPFSQNDQMEVSNVIKPIPETTTETTKKENIYSEPSNFRHVEYLPDDVLSIRTALVAIVQDQLWEPTETRFNEAAYLLYEQNVTVEHIRGFADWWKVNGHYNGKPALKSVISKWNQYKQPVTAVSQDPEVEAVMIDGELKFKVVNNGHNR